MGRIGYRTSTKIRWRHIEKLGFEPPYSKYMYWVSSVTCKLGRRFVISKRHTIRPLPQVAANVIPLLVSQLLQSIYSPMSPCDILAMFCLVRPAECPPANWIFKLLPVKPHLSINLGLTLQLEGKSAQIIWLAQNSTVFCHASSSLYLCFGVVYLQDELFPFLFTTIT